MDRKPLDNLVKIGHLKTELPDKQEIAGLIHSGKVRLRDAEIQDLSLESRFDLAYNAAHALALAALRYHGYRSENRYQVFQCLIHTLQLPNEQWRVLDAAHRKRNIAEYEGYLEADNNLVESLIRVATQVQEKLQNLPPLE